MYQIEELKAYATIVCELQNRRNGERKQAKTWLEIKIFTLLNLVKNLVFQMIGRTIFCELSLVFLLDRGRIRKTTHEGWMYNILISLSPFPLLNFPVLLFESKGVHIGKMFQVISNKYNCVKYLSVKGNGGNQRVSSSLCVSSSQMRRFTCGGFD